MNNDYYKKLMEPGRIGRATTRNRIVKTGAGSSFVGEGGFVGDQMTGFYGGLAKGGVGLVIVESTGVEFPAGTHHPSVQCHIEDDKFIPGYTKLTERVHSYNGTVFMQLFHSGPWHPKSWMGIQPISSSALTKAELPVPHLDEPREASVDEIKGLVEKFAQGALRASKAGFDGVEVNASSCHLINSFLSRAWNKRTDEYGCETLENRSRFLVEIIKGIKQLVGADFPVSGLITALECGVPNGTTIPEAQEIARILENAGIDALQVRAYGYRNLEFIHPGPEQLLYPEPMDELPKELDWSKNGAGAFVPLSEIMKKTVKIPVMVVGRLDPELGEQVMEEGKADFICMNRRLLADPELPNKIAAGTADKIAPCTACCFCWHTRKQNQPIRCRVNSSLGREWEHSLEPAEVKKKVVVVGGGPAGMEAARVAALRGHTVTLIEKESKHGGLLPLASMVKGFEIEDIPCLLRYFRTQLDSLNITQEYGKEADAEMVLRHSPDVVILATGGLNATPDIPGIDNKLVVQNTEFHKMLKFFLRFFSPQMLRRLTKIWMPVGRNVTIIGSGIQGVELAEYLTKRKRKVTIIDSAKEAGIGMVPDEVRQRLLAWLKLKGTTFFTGAKIKDITPKGINITTSDGTELFIRANTIIPALPLQSNNKLAEELKGKVKEIYQAGDCSEPGLIPDATGDGGHIAYII